MIENTGSNVLDKSAMNAGAALLNFAGFPFCEMKESTKNHWKFVHLVAEKGSKTK
jgi:hypothetical protein